MNIAVPRTRSGPARGISRSTTADDIIHAAEKIFAEMGYAGASLDEIAAAVGIRRPSVLHHFRSKREIYDCVERQIFHDLEKIVSEKIDGLPPAEALTALLDSWLDFMVDRPTAARIIARNASDLISRSEDNPTLFSEAVISTFETIIAIGIAQGVFRNVNPALVLNIIGSAIPSYVCNARQFGSGREYSAQDRDLRKTFRDLLHAALNSILHGNEKC